MGRPRKRTEEKKSKPIPIKFSLLDLVKIDKQAEKEKLQRSVWIRKTILEKLNGATK